MINKKLINVGAEAVCNTDDVQPFGADSAFSSNVALYQLDGNADDTTGNYNGTATNVTYSTGNFGQAAVFNGSSSKIDISATSTTPFDASQENFTISLWVNVSSFGDSDVFISKWGNTDSNRAYWLGLQTSSGDISKIAIYERSGSTSYTFNGSTSLSTNTWHHIVYVRNTTQILLYIDNSAEVFSATNSINQGGSENVVIGQYDSISASTLNGKIDQVRIFDKAISAEDVATLYAETSSTASDTNPLGEGSGVALYTLDYDASDAGGNYDGTPSNVEFGVGGQINYGARFNGSSYITYNSFLSTTTDNSDASFSIWVKFNSFASSQAISSGLSGQYPPFNMYVYHSGGTSTFAFERGFGGTIYYSTTYNSEIQASTSVDTWYHIVYTYTASTKAIEVFLNGSSIGTDTLNTSTSGTITATQLLGGINSSGSIDADLDQYRIFSKALSSSEVSTLYAETACTYTCTTDTVDYPTTNVAYYKLDNSAEDETGSYDGTTTNVSYEFGRYGQAAHFSSGTFITSSFASLSQVTVSFWVKMTDVDTTRAFFVSRYGTNREFAIYTYDNSFNASLYYNGNNGNAIIITTSDYFNDNTWHHIAYTANGSTSPKLYIDGVERGTAQYSDATRCAYYTSSEPLSMGYSRTSSAYNSWDGRLDQVRIFSSALTSAQVTQLYEEKPCEDTSNFKAVLWKGNNTTGHFINNVGMDLETNGGLVWIKSRNDVDNHIWQDNVRGITNYIMSSSTLQQFNSDMVVSLEKTGFVLGADTPTGVNTNNIDFVAWVWKGGGDAVNIGVNSITASTPSIASDVSANTEAGFSIVKYTGDGTAGSTVPHGLSAKPEFILIKNLDSALNWIAYDTNINSVGYLDLSDAFATSRLSWAFNSTDPTDTLITLGSNNAVNASSNDYIAYCFHSVSGVSKVGSYTSTGVSGQAITGLGFAPSFVMIKNADDVGSWIIHDKARNPNNPSTSHLRADTNGIEDTGANEQIDFDSDGFTLNGTGQNINHSDLDTYIYLAFA